MLLSQVIARLPVVAVRGPTDVAVSRVDHDSRQVAPGSLFCCVPGARSDGHRFAAAAVQAGAVALLVERPVEAPGATQVEVPDVRAAMALASAAVAGDPSRSMTVVGITGTNGKTTTTYLLRSVLEEAGRRCAVLGTVSGAGAAAGPPTTPDAPDLQRWLAERRDEGVDAVAMEVSSHALASHRPDGTRFAAAVFTNLTPDHLDFHGDMGAYFEAKARLFSPELSERGIVNVDDAYGRRLLLADAGVPVTGYGLADADDLRIGPTGSTFTWRGSPVRLALAARFNVLNALGAATAAAALGIDVPVIAAGLSRPVAVPGRFESVDEGQPFRVVVDYAHTPDGIEQVLRAVRETSGEGRVHVVFGCGGERDTAKRPLMGAAAARLADRVVITADNSRHEDTRAIIGAVREGAIHTTGAVAGEIVAEPDREAAIAGALAAARPGDTVVIAGKGHETTLTIGERTVDFDDREVARRHLRMLSASTQHPPAAGCGESGRAS